METDKDGLLMFDKEFSVFFLGQRLVYQPQPHSPKSQAARFSELREN
jgi:hypothetical protein